MKSISSLRLGRVLFGKCFLVKRIVSTFICAVLVLTSVSLIGLAVEEEDTVLKTSTSESAKGENPLSEVIAEAVNEQKEDRSSSNQSYSVYDANINELTVSISYFAIMDCIILAALYDESTMQMISSGKVKANAEETSTDIRLDECELPAYYFVKVYILNSDFEPLSDAFTINTHTKRMEEFFRYSINDFNKEYLVLNENENNFAVVTSDAIIIECSENENKLISNDFENRKYVFANANNHLLSLKEGDIVYIPFTDDFVLGTVESVDTVSNGNVVIQTTPDENLVNLFEYIRIDTAITERASSRKTKKMSKKDGSNEPEEGAHSHSINASVPVSTTFPKKWVEKKDEIESETVSMEGKGKPESKVSVNFSLLFSIGLDIKYYYHAQWGPDSYLFDYSSTKKVTGKTSITAKAAFNYTLTLASIEIPTEIPGLYVYAQFVFTFDVSGEMLATGKIEITFDKRSYKEKNLSQNILTDYSSNSKPTTKISFDYNVKATVTAGLRAAVGVNLFKKILDVSVFAEFKVTGIFEIMDVKVTPSEVGSTFFNQEYVLEAQTSRMPTEHDCTVCLIADFSSELSFGIKLSFNIVKPVSPSSRVVKLKEIFNATPKATITIPIGKFRISFINGSFEYKLMVGDEKCPHISYLTAFELLDEKNKSVNNVQIKITKMEGEGDDLTIFNDTTKTVYSNDGGLAYCYLPSGTYKYEILNDEYSVLSSNPQGNIFIVNNDTSSISVKIKIFNPVHFSVVNTKNEPVPYAVVSCDKKSKKADVNGMGTIGAETGERDFWVKTPSGAEAVFHKDVGENDDFTFVINIGNYFNATILNKYDEPMQEVAVTMPDGETMFSDANGKVSGFYIPGTYDVCFRIGDVERLESITIADASIDITVKLNIGCRVNCIVQSEANKRLSGVPIDNFGRTNANGELTIYLDKGNYSTTATNYDGSSATQDFTVEESGLTLKYVLKSNLEFSYSNGVLRISGSGVIPANYVEKNYSRNGLHGYTGIRELIIEEGITGIGSWAFGDCTSLRKITLPSSMKTIASDAFAFDSMRIYEYHYKETREIYIDDIKMWCELSSSTDNYSQGEYSYANGRWGNVGSISGVSFGSTRCKLYINGIEEKDITSFVVPEGTTTINNFPCSSCLTSITIPDSVECISTTVPLGGPWYESQPEGVVYLAGFAVAYKGEGRADGSLVLREETKGILQRAFYNQTWIANVIIPDSIMYIGSQAFSGCSNITNVSISSGLKAIGNNAFEGCSRLENLDFPTGLISVGSDAFSGCSSLENLAFPAGLISVGQKAFNSCTNLKQVSIPDSVVFLGEAVFFGCNSIEKISLPFEDEGYTIDSLFREYTIVGSSSDMHWTWLGTIPETLKTIKVAGGKDLPQNAFQNCASLETIEIPDCVESIGANAFDNCGATTVKFYHVDGGTGVCDSALEGITTIENVIIGEGVPSIGKAAFYQCTHLQSVVVSNGVKTIGQWPFYRCSSLGSIVLPDSVLSIGDSAFSNCANLALVRLPNQLRVIPKNAFSGCGSLTEIEIPETVERIEENAFASCAKMEEIVLPEGLVYLGWGAFSTKRATIPGTLKYLTSGNYKSFSAEELIIIGTEIADYSLANYSAIQKVIITDSVTRIGTGAFDSCRNLVEVVLPNGLQSIGDNAFQGCSALDAIDLPESIKTIGDAAFSRCTSLKTLAFPESIEIMGEAALEGCASLESLVLPFVGKQRHNTEGTTENLFGFIFGNNSFDESYEVCQKCDVSPNPNYFSQTRHDLPKALTRVEVFGGELRYGEFSDCRYIQSIVLREGITKIGAYAFYGCTALEEIAFPKDLDSIATSAFERCEGLSSIALPVHLRDINEGAFMYCKSLNSVSLGNRITRIPTYCFRGCSALQSVVIPDGVTTIEEFAFLDCSSLVSAVIPASLVGIERCAFENCSALEHIRLPLNLNSIGKSAFEKCESLKEIILPENCAFVETRAFCDCSSVETIEIPRSITDIREGTFWGCDYVEDLTIWGNDLTIEKNAFPVGVKTLHLYENLDLSSKSDLIVDTFLYEGTGRFDMQLKRMSIQAKRVILCEGVTDISDEVFYNQQGMTWVSLPSSITALSNNMFKGCSQLTNVRIPEGITSIGEGCFGGCTSLKEIDIPESVETIGRYAFEGCQSLVRVDLPTGLEVVEDALFNRCVSLTEVTIPPGVRSIKGRAFSNCSSLNNFVVPENVIIIDKRAFENSDNLKKLTLPGHLNISDLVSSVTELIITGNEVAEYCFARLPNVETIILSQSVERIGANAFYSCTNLSEIQLSDCLKSIGNNAFNNCSNLTSIKIPNGVVEIGTGAFGGCKSLKKIKIPNGVTKIGSLAFWNCIGLKRIIVPGSISDIEPNTFSGCTGVETVIVSDGVKTIKGNAFSNCTSLVVVELPESLITIENGAFEGCVELQSITLPGSLTDLRDEAFRGCTNLKRIMTPGSTRVYLSKVSIEEIVVTGLAIAENAFYNMATVKSFVLPEGLTEIGNNAFYNCTGIKAIGLPDSLKSIGAHAFCGCDNLESIVFPEGLINIGFDSFGLCNKLKEISIPRSVETIGASAFRQCKSLERVSIPSGIKATGGGAFEACTSLLEVTIPSSFEYVPNSAFRGCTGMKAVFLSSGIKRIDHFAFDGCSDLSSITIPKSVERIAQRAFYGCENLTDVYYGGSEVDWEGMFFGSDNDSLRNATIHYNSLEIECKHENVVLVDQQAGTCSSPGYTAGVCCADCGEWLSGHEEIVVPHTDADNDKHCDNCGLSMIVLQGSMGDTATWTLDCFGTLDFNGTGDLDPEQVVFAWSSHVDKINKVVFEEGITGINGVLLRTCFCVKEIILPSTMKSLDENAFWSCLELNRIVNKSSTIVCSKGKFNKANFPDGWDYSMFYQFVVDTRMIVQGLEESESIPEGINEKYGLSLLTIEDYYAFVNSFQAIEGMPDGLVFYCYADSAEHRYCQEKGIAFELLERPLQSSGHTPSDLVDKTNDPLSRTGNIQEETNSFQIPKHTHSGEALSHIKDGNNNRMSDMVEDDVKSTLLCSNVEPDSTKKASLFNILKTEKAFSKAKASEQKQYTVENPQEGDWYLIYVVKDETAEDLIVSHNLIYVDQKTADKGVLNFSLPLEKSDIPYEVIVKHAHSLVNKEIEPTAVSVEWTWGDDYSFAQARIISDHGDVLADELPAVISTSISNVSCESSGVTIYSAAVEYESEVFTDIREIKRGAIGHTLPDEEGCCALCGKELSTTATTPGDINGDGVLNNKDLNRLMKYLAGDDVEVVEAALDLNGDGNVNNKDLNRLMKYLAGEDVEIF